MDLTSTHWGVYRVESDGDRVSALHAYEADPHPSPIGYAMPEALTHACRIRRPAIRKSFLEDGPGHGQRGADEFVEVSWDVALDLLAAELKTVIAEHGNESIYAGSYGWASAGRFNHAQSQIHRFLNLLGGYTASFNTYSTAAAEVILPHLIGRGVPWFSDWRAVTEHSELLISFGGLPLKNTQVQSSGASRHEARDWLLDCANAGIEFVSFSPIKEDLPDFVNGRWHASRPGTDTAIMLGLAHTLYSNGWHDSDFLTRYCAGFERFADYLLGRSDGQPKSAQWAADIADIEPEVILDLAGRMAQKRTMINAAWSIQRTDHGEQPYWMLVTLASMLGQIGLPGGGFAAGYCAESAIGRGGVNFSGPYLPQGANPVRTSIPVARISDMLLNPGGRFDYNGETYEYPDISLVYWAGGNPYHHHQDLNRLHEAWQRPRTVVVHEQFWNAMAKHADIVLPASTSLERNDIGSSVRDNAIIAMKQGMPPVGESRSDHAIFADLGKRLGVEQAFTEGRNEMQWLRHIYEESRPRAQKRGIELPEFDDFWKDGVFEYEGDTTPRVQMAKFRADPEGNPLTTPSGKIEVFSETIAGFELNDCPGHATWIEPSERLGGEGASRFPLHLCSNQPKRRLHGQYDHSAWSAKGKIQGREAMLIHPELARERGLSAGDVVRVFNDRGACLAGVELRQDIRPDVVQLATGAWYDPVEPGVPGTLCSHGNPNILTRDKGTSSLAQGPSAHSCLVDIEKFEGELPPIRAFEPPPGVAALPHESPISKGVV